MTKKLKGLADQLFLDKARNWLEEATVNRTNQKEQVTYEEDMAIESEDCKECITKNTIGCKASTQTEDCDLAKSNRVENINEANANISKMGDTYRNFLSIVNLSWPDEAFTRTQI